MRLNCNCRGIIMRFKKLIAIVTRNRKFMTIAVPIASIIIICYICAVAIRKRNTRTFPYDPVEVNPLDKPTCNSCHQAKQGPSFLRSQYNGSQCSDIVNNMVKGKWVERNYDDIKKDKAELDELLANFRVRHEGVSRNPFRSTNKKCGYRHQLPSPWLHPVLLDISSWCDPKSNKPCCSHHFDGVCIEENKCLLKGSINLKSFVHAEVSDWVPTDQNCKIQIYNQETGCALLHDKKVKSIGMVGNSLMRNIYSVMLQMLTNNYHNGSMGCCMPPSIRKKCVGYWQNMDKYCLAYGLVSSSKELPEYGICNGHNDIELYLRGYWMAYMGDELKQHIIELLDKPGTYLLVGIGVHDRHNATKMITEYLQPSFEILSGHEWPKLIWIHALKTGIFKPPSLVAFHGTDDDIDKYVEEIGQFCARHNIPALDFRPLTTGVWSVDGTHYGTGVNHMKIQMFLNLLSSNQVL